MFNHVAALCSGQPEAAEAFVGSIRAGGYWQRVARRLAPDLLQHNCSPSQVFLCIDFLITRERYLRALHSLVYEPLLQLRHDMAAATRTRCLRISCLRRNRWGASANSRPVHQSRQPGSALQTPSTIQPALYIDLELNCPDRFRPDDSDPEIIEIGIVELDINSLRIIRERDYLVRPRPDISRRCKKITGLTNEDFKSAQPFMDVVAGIDSEWPGRAISIAWGEDGATLTRACQQHRVRMPFRRSIDLSQIVRQFSLYRAKDPVLPSNDGSIRSAE